MTRMIGVALSLAAAQALRAAIAVPLWAIVRLDNHDLRVPLISALSFMILAALLWVWRRPRAAELGLQWSQTSRLERWAYVGGAALLLMLTLVSGLFDRGLLLVNLSSVWVTPAFEELLFRGYCWRRIAPAIRGKYSGLWTWALTTALFGLWHLGYVDHLLRVLPLHPQAEPLRMVLFWKVVIGAAVGFWAGLARWRTGKVYAAFLVHAFWNLFGR